MAREWQELNRPLRLGIYGFWPGFAPRTSPLVGLLQSQVEVEFVPLSQGADYTDVVLCSVFGGCGPRNEALGRFDKPDLIKEAFTMQYSGEALKNFGPHLHWAEYHLGFLPDSSDHFYLPHWLHDMLSYDHTTRLLTFNDKLRPLTTKDQFCAIYASHDKAGQRARLFNELNEYKPVHSYGTWNNNRPNDGARNDEFNRSAKKMTVLDRYKYSLAVENCSEPWYVTEKLSESILSNTIPIYWGAPNLDQSPFNLKRVIDATNLTPSEMVEKVIILDYDPASYAKMLKQPMFSRPVFPEGLAARSDILLKRILEQKA